MEKKKTQTVIIVTAYGEDNFYQKKFEDIVGIYTTVKGAIQGAKKDGLTKRQMDYLNRINAFYCLDVALQENNNHEAFQVDYEDGYKCESSYMFRTFNLD